MTAVIRQSAALDLGSALRLLKMTAADLDDILAVEQEIYSQPWTRGNFADSISSGYQCHFAVDQSGSVVGYFLMMLLVDEAHLLNLSVRADLHHQGFGRYLLGRAVQIALQNTMTSMLLEVRPTNHRALAVYERFGFLRIGMRRQYYPAANGQREDAIVMRLTL